jgi:tetratricopeptide (TPR) repeat protein
MNRLLIGLVGVWLLTALPVLGTGAREQDLSDDISNTSTNEDQALDKVMEDDDAALDEVNLWIQENNAYVAKGAGETKAQLNQRILARLKTVREGYAGFLKNYPKSARGYLAYGSFLNDIGEEDSARDQYERSRELDPTNPASWNDLANYYGENGPTTNAFAYYARATELDPTESVYYENWATTVYLYRPDARRFYGITESQVFDKALALYQKAVQLDPTNFTLMTDYAESYYGIRPLRTNDALEAWTNALKIASDDVEREGVYIHLARIKISAGRYAEAQAQLDEVTNSTYNDLKRRLQRNLLAKENPTTNDAVMMVTNTAASLTNVPVFAPARPNTP